MKAKDASTEDDHLLNIPLSGKLLTLLFYRRFYTFICDRL